MTGLKKGRYVAILWSSPQSTSLAATQIDPKGNDDTSFLYRQFSFPLHSTASPVFGEGERFDFGKISSPLS